MERLIAHAAELYALDAPVVLAGDYNVVPTDADIYPTKSYKDNALVQPEPRALFARLLGQGWIDAIRTLHPDATSSRTVLPPAGSGPVARARVKLDDISSIRGTARIRLATTTAGLIGLSENHGAC